MSFLGDLFAGQLSGGMFPSISHSNPVPENDPYISAGDSQGQQEANNEHFELNESMGETPSTANGDSFGGDDWEEIKAYLDRMQKTSAEESARRWAEAVKQQEKMQKDTQEWNALEAEKNRLWQEKMRASQYQTMMQDLKEAGINPILLFGGGLQSGGTPGGATAHSGNANYVPGSFGDTQVSREKFQIIQQIIFGAMAIGNGISDILGFKLPKLHKLIK